MKKYLFVMLTVFLIFGSACLEQSGPWSVVMGIMKKGFIDKSGNQVIPLSYENVTDFSEGMAGVYEKLKFGFIDNTGKAITPLLLLKGLPA